MAILGQVTIDEIAIYSVNADPSGDGFPAAIGSIASLDDDTNGRLWIKSGAGNTAWSIIPRLPNATALTANRFVFPDANGMLVTTPTALWEGGSGGRFSFGLNAPAVPQSTIHLDRGTGQGVHVRMTAGTTTGVAAGDGTEFGIDNAGNAEILQRENSAINFYTNNILRGAFAPAGNLILGSPATPIDITGASTFPQFQILGTSAVQMAGIQYSADPIGPVFNLLKSRGVTVGTHAATQAEDEFGRIQFRASDGVNFVAGASIRALVESAPTAGVSMPGYLVMMTTPVGSTVPVERMRITSTGLSIFSQGVRIGNETSTVGGNIRYVSDTDVQGYVDGNWRSLINVPYNIASATASTTTTSATDVLMDSMTITPGAGTYFVMFGTTLQSSSANAQLFVSIYSNSVQVAHSQRQAQPRVNASGGLGGNGNLTIDTVVSTQAVVTVGAGQTIEVRWRRSAGTATALQRSLTLIKVNI